jgi:hypothetical protein
MALEKAQSIFPIYGGKSYNNAGMDLRTYIATAALKGMNANSSMRFDSADTLAELAVEQADALINALNKEK